MEQRGKRQASSIFGGTGFYIALLVCVLAAGVAGYWALLGVTDKSTPTDTTNSQSVSQSDPGPSTAVTAPEDTTAKPVIGQEPVVASRPTEPSQTELEAAATPDTGLVLVEADPPPVTTTAPTATKIVSPLAGETVAAFSMEQLTYDATLGDWRTHDGVDICAEAGSQVVSASAGRVSAVETDPRLGTKVVIDHGNGYVTTYASLQEDVCVLAGDQVKAGTVIGTVGNTSLSEAALGAHLHFSVTKDGKAVDPHVYLNQ